MVCSSVLAFRDLAIAQDGVEPLLLHPKQTDRQLAEIVAIRTNRKLAGAPKRIGGLKLARRWRGF
jgi:hypothetical protein